MNKNYDSVYDFINKLDGYFYSLAIEKINKSIISEVYLLNPASKTIDKIEIDDNSNMINIYTSYRLVNCA